MSDTEASLAALQAHGMAFLQSFGLPTTTLASKRPIDAPQSKRASKRRRISPVDEISVASSSSDEDNVASDEDELEDDSDSDSDPDEEDHTEDDDENIGQLPASPAPASTRQPEVVVFDGSPSIRTPLKPKSSQRAFMSSKISRVVRDPESAGISGPSANDEEGTEDADRSNAKNDTELYRLLHTSLLSSTGTSSSSLLSSLSSAQRKKALEGRVLELADRSRFGKGEKDVRLIERKKASLHVRIGMKEKAKERQAKHVEEAKNVGNYHPALKKLFSSPASASASSYQLSNEARKPAAKRERGLSMGIGRHTSSGLKISREDIARVNATGSGNGGAGRRGGKGGKGKGK